MKKENLKLLDNEDVIRWCYEGITDISLKNTESEKNLKGSKKIEQKWGNDVIKTIGGKQWTTVLCQDLVMEALIKFGRKNVRATTSKKSSIRNKKYDPDLECDDYVYEVKGRSWSTPGTAGEKILGVPLKYGEIPRLYKKPLQIILVGYQEYEAREKFAFGDLLDRNNQTPELRKSLAFYKEQEIEYVAFTDILKEIGYPYGCWNSKETVSPYVIKSEMISVPLVGSAPCGNPLICEENIEEMIMVEKNKIKPGTKYFILKAMGDSMDKAGIKDGDLVLCRFSEKGETGDSVVALLGGENVTIKYYDKKDGKRILLPKSTNPEHEPIIPKEGDIVQGIVQEVIERKE